MKPATSIEKVCRVLRVLRTQPALGVNELAEKTGLLQSDAHRILSSLRAFGHVEQDAESKKYRLGLELLKLGYYVYQNLNLRELAKPYMQSLSEMAAATSNLAILDARELEIVFVEQVDSPDEFQVRLRIGARASPHATAVGKMITAHQDRAVAIRMLQKDLVKKTRRTITDIDVLMAEFEKIRTLGYAMDLEEAVMGACCISAPVRDHTGDVVAALSISMMASRLSPAHESSGVKLVRATAAKISAAVGYEPGRHGHAALADVIAPASGPASGRAKPPVGQPGFDDAS